jgi:cytosine/adenosine deaminase-related metal-dependent hydrolase/ubiquinone/menaquinone biosynthesis C-methylase UbiE
VNLSNEFATTPDNAGDFAAWAEVYDQQANPLLSLEERYLARLLPECKARHVLDVGCGTGRWLTRLARCEPASLLGMDSSARMLDLAQAKQLPNTALQYGALPSLPVPSASADLILASFVMSYVEDLGRTAAELARVTRANGDLFISDMHPETSVALGWKRGFDANGQSFRLTTQTWPLTRLIEEFTSNGFSLAAHIEPHFEKPERALFLARGKEEAWQQAAGMPAIYMLHLRRLPLATPRPVTPVSTGALSLQDAQCALGARERLTASVSVDRGSVASISSPQAGNAPSIDLRGYLLLPGLVNSHEHLEFALFPRLGSPPYQNTTQWAHDIRANAEETIALHRQVPKDIRLWWGGIRNLLCGATTVCQHNPLHAALQDDDFPVRVVANYGWEHSLTFAKDIPGALQRTSAGHPFFIHACEGIDDASAEELSALDDIGVLDERSILVHGLALDDQGTDLLNARRSALVICPSSNQFLFQKTHTLERLRSIERLALGSDSPLTANGDLLDELRFAHAACGLRADELYGMVTDRAADIVRLDRGEGTLRVGAVADFIAIEARPGTPAEVLAGASWRDVELVCVGGRVHLASQNIIARLSPELRQGLAPLMVEDTLRWLRAPISALLQAAENVLGIGNVRVGGLRASRADGWLDAS